MTNDRLLAAVAGAMVIFAALLVVIIATEPVRLQQARAEATGDEIERGALLYHDHCRSCHGVRGEGVGQLGPPLADTTFFTTRRTEVGWTSTLRSYILATIEHGRLMGTRPIYVGNGSTAVMPAWLDRYDGPLRSDQIQAIATFIHNWEDTALGQVQLEPLVLAETAPHDAKAISRGREVFIRSCASCHTFDDIKAASYAGPDLSNIDVPTSDKPDPADQQNYIQESVLIPEATIKSEYAEQADANPCGAILTVTELRDVIVYLLQ